MHPEMEEYLEILEGQDKAVGTLRQYSGGLNAFADWLDQEGLDYLDVEKRGIQRYLSWLKNEREYAPKTIRGYFSPVSGFYEDQVDAGFLEDDPTENITVANYAPKTTRKSEESKEQRIWLEQDQFDTLVENVPAPSIRNRLVVLMMYYTGLRRQEVADIELSDLDREERELRVSGKGDKLHTAYWQPKLDGLLTTWLERGYREASPYAKESPYLFVSESGETITGDRVNKIVRQAAENAGMQEVLYVDAAGRNQYKITSHVVRHSFAMNFLDNGGSWGDLSKLMAHNNFETTRVYAEIQDSRAKEAYEDHAPDADLTI